MEPSVVGAAGCTEEVCLFYPGEDSGGIQDGSINIVGVYVHEAGVGVVAAGATHLRERFVSAGLSAHRASPCASSSVRESISSSELVSG